MHKLIALVGPESCGKTTLALELAAHLQACLVHEYAREYFSEQSPLKAYTSDDVLKIAKAQWCREQQAIEGRKYPIVLDTDLLVLDIWCLFKYGQTPAWIQEKLDKQPDRAYLLMSPDIPWRADPLRENPHNRVEIFKLYENALKQGQREYVCIRGTQAERLEQALLFIGE